MDEAGRPHGAVRAVLVEDHAIVAEGIRQLIEATGRVTVGFVARSVDQALAAIAQDRPDVVILDVQLGSEDGLDVVRRLREEGTTTPVLVLSAMDDATAVQAAVSAGANGYLAKTAQRDTLIDAVLATARGETVVDPRLLSQLWEAAGSRPVTLTPEERRLLELVAEGRSNQSVGARLHLSASAVQKRVDRLCERLGARDRTELVANAFRQGLLE